MKPRLIVAIITLVQLIGIFVADIGAGDITVNDSPAYLHFITSISQGRLDFSQSGFQGSTLPAIPVYLLTHSPLSFTLVGLIFGLINIPLMYLTTQQIFKNSQLALIATLFFAMTPEITFSGLFGYPQTVFHFATLLTVYCLYAKPQYSGLTYGWSMISKPFSVTLLPFFIANKRYRQIIVGICVGLLYLSLQYFANGKIIIGVHPDISPVHVFKPTRFFYNLASAPPLIFSLHNYLISAPTTVGDRLQTSPFVIFAAIFSVFYLKKLYPSLKIYKTLTAFALLSFLLPNFIPYLDTNYLQTFLIAAIWIALPFYQKYPAFLPITILTASYQFLYMILGNQHMWIAPTSILIYIIPATCFLISIYLTTKATKLSLIPYSD